MRLKKWSGNPILSPNPGNEWEKMAVLNPGAIYDGKKVSLLYRASGDLVDYRIYIGLAESRDGFNFERVSNQPVLGPSEDGFDAGCIEDARVVNIDGTYFMTYAARAHPPCAHWSGRKRRNLPAQTPTWTENITRSGIACSTDLRHWERLGPCTNEYLDNRDVILFPERIKGKYVMMHRAIDRTGGQRYPQYKTAAIWLTYSDDMQHWTGDMAIARTQAPWEGDWLGGAAPPIRTDEGWLTLYHAVADLDGKGRAYRVGAMLLDLEHPQTVIARGPDFILEPEEPFELKGCGAAERVVFPCGNVVIGDELFVYYGGADTVCCVATAKLADLLTWLRESKQHSKSASHMKGLTPMTANCYSLGQGTIALRGGVFNDRFRLNRNYVASLKTENLLQNFLLEAGLTAYQLRNSSHGSPDAGDERHWGWESPSCQVRGHFLGHWLSAAARIWATNGDSELKHKADAVVAELARCQQKNGGEWCGPFPEKYMTWLANGTPTWAPQYVHHKTLMGLVDMYAYAANQQALEIADRFATWFHRWSAGFSRAQMDAILDVETGGMLESWANLYAATGHRKYLELMERYTRNRLFGPLLEGRDALTNLHANTTIPEAQGAARCYEVTGDERWRKIAEAYWKCAVTDRGTFCTGSQTTGEIWTPPFEFATRRGDKNQEHCVVYNMIRLAEYLFRWTGEAAYADYIERNLYNGILAQQHPGTGMITYFLPLEAGGRKRWGHPTYDFWCCHGSLVQAHSIHNTLIYYETADGLVVAQYIPSELKTEVRGVKVNIRQEFDHQNWGSASDNSSASGSRHRPANWAVNFKVECATPVEFVLNLRLPEWLRGQAEILVNGQPCDVRNRPPAFEPLRRTWKDDTVRLVLPKALWTAPIPDEPDTVAFMDGPIALAGLCEHETRLCGDKSKPSTILVPDNEREWGNWVGNYRTVGQRDSIRFKPLHEVVDERYTMYFPCSCGDTAGHASNG